MYLNILKKDLKRKKTMNAILLIFIILAAMFVASGLNNVVTVLNGTNYYFDKAEIGDYIVLTMGDEAVGYSSDILSKEDCIKSFKTETVVYGSQENVFLENGEKAYTTSITIFQSIENSKLNYFDINNKKIEETAPGKVYVSGSFLAENNLAPGNFINIEVGKTKMKLEVAGKSKDALFGSDFMGNTRFLLNDADYQKILSDDNIKQHYQGEIIYIETDDLDKTASAVSKIPGLSFDKPRETIKICYVMEMIVAFIVLILSICLIIVSFVVLRFSISFTISEEFREIGIMKAIGLKNGKIRGLYLVKYLMLSLIGAVIGFFLSIPFGNLLLKSVSNNMVLGNDMGLLINVFSAAAATAVILFFAYICTSKVKKLSPIDAIRSGQTGERFRKKTVLRIEKANVRPNLYLALNDILSSPKRFLTIIVSFFICTLFVLMLENTTATMNSPNLITTFAAKSDLYVNDIETAMKQMSIASKSSVEEFLKEKEEELADNGMPAKLGVDPLYKYKITCGGKDFSLPCVQSIGIDADRYEYFEGTAPQHKNEIAVTPQISEKTGAKIGDTVTVDFGTEKLDCIVTAYFNSMMQLGETIRLHEDAPTDMKYVSTIGSYQIDFTDSPSSDEIEKRKNEVKNIFNVDADKVQNATEYCVELLEVTDVMEAVKYLLLAITLIVVVLVTILVEHSFISDERSQISMLKAIGFKNSDIIKWHIYRFGITALAAAVLAGIASIPMTNLCITPIFGIMGATKVNYNINPLRVFLLYPALVMGMTVISAWITAQYTRKIKTSEMNSIE